MHRRQFLASAVTAATATTSFARPGIVRAQTPVASPTTSGTIRHADIPGSALALSPDGTMLAGVIDRERIAVWDTGTFEIVAESAPLDELSLLDETSLTWSPDSTALAWSLLAAMQLRDSDIYVFDVDSGEIGNLTDDEPTDMDAAGLPLGEPPADYQPLDVDILPSWTADSERIVFARTVWDTTADGGTSLMSISRNGGDATGMAIISPDEIFLPNAIRADMDDGSVLYSTWPPSLDGPNHGVFLLTPDGQVESVSTGMLIRDITAPVLMDVALHARKAAIVSARNYAQLDLSDRPHFTEMDLDTGIPTAFETVLGLPDVYTEAIRDGLLLHGSPAFVTTPDGEVDGYIYATSSGGNERISVWRHHLASGESDILGSLDLEGVDISPARTYNRVELGANGTAAIFHAGTALLATVEG